MSLRVLTVAATGAVLGHGGAIEVGVADGVATLQGPVLAEDLDRLLRGVRNVRGVREVVDQLDVRDEPGRVPGLQGRPRPPRGGEVFELLQRDRSPTARLSGATLALWGVRRLDAVGMVVAAWRC